MKRFLVAAGALLFAVSGFSQHHEQCGAHINLLQQLEDSENRAKYEDFQEALRRYAQDPKVPVNRDENGVRIIPVVFHILHDDGNENISKDKVLEQMEVLNEDYRRLNKDTVNTPERFYGDTEYTHFAINSDSILGMIDTTSFISLSNRYGESFAFHFNVTQANAHDSIVDQQDLADSLKLLFDVAVEVSLLGVSDTMEIAMALANAINDQNGLSASFERDTTFALAPNFTVGGVEIDSLNYTSEHTFTTSWNGSSTDTIYSDTLMVILYEDLQNPFSSTDTLYVFDADVEYDVFDGSGNVTGTNTFNSEGSLILIHTAVPVAFGDYRVDVMTDGLGYTDDAYVSGVWSVAAFIDQQGTYLPADSKVEFRLATKDPLGNCTDGIVRVFTSKTNGVNDATGFKGESYWNSYQYLNVWVVSSIDVGNTNGITLGYAQFPVSGPASTDGITVRASNIGAANSGGRTATHEVGHWLSLRHIWGDALCGSDEVADTPTAANPNFNVCGNHPTEDPYNGSSDYHTVPYNLPGCDPNNPDGEMFNNYMDYSSDLCQNMFTLGQKARMDFTFHGDENTTGYRSLLISQENLVATGVADPYSPSDCAPISSFYFNQTGIDFATRKMICVGEEVDFEEDVYNAEVDSYSWIFEGGDPATSSVSDPSSTYNTPGVYDVSLTASNAAGSNTHTEEGMVIVSSTEAQYSNDWGHVTTFWPEDAFYQDFVVYNHDDSPNKWEWFAATNGGYQDYHSVRMFNLDNNLDEVDELISPSYDLSTIPGAKLKFRYSGAAIDATPSDRLEVRVSDDCGETWGASRLTLEGHELCNAGLSSNGYRPGENSTWDDVTVDLGSADDKPNVRILFRWISGGRSNNFYIDDITLSLAPIGMEDLERQIGLSIAPNPTLDRTSVTMNLVDASNVRMEILDVLGKNVTPILNRSMSVGSHKFDVDMSNFTSGVYYLRIMVDGDMLVKKVVKN